MSLTREEIIAKLFRAYYGKKLSNNTVKEVNQILEEQFKDNYLTEIGGSIFSEQGKLELKIIKSNEMENLESSLEQFELGDNSKLEELSRFAQDYTKRRQENLSAESLHYQSLKLICDVLSDPPEKIDTHRKEVCHLYRTFIIATTYRFFPSKMGLDQKEFRGLFHVHKNGTAPSEGDLQFNKNIPIPNLLISATPDYQETGVTIYLIHQGDYEILYQGHLEAEKQ